MPQLRDAGAALALPVGDAPFSMRLRPTADGADLAISGAANVAIAETTLEVHADGILALGKDFAMRRISFPRADMRLRDLAVAGHRLEQLHVTGAIDGTPRDLKGTADLTAELAAMRIETVAVGAATSSLAAGFHWTGNRLELHQSGDGSVSVASIGLGDAARIARPVTALLTDGALTFGLTPNGPSYSHAITIRPKRMTVELPSPDAAPLAIRANTGPVKLEGGADPGIPYRGLLTLNRGRFAISDQALSAEAVSASLAFPSVAGERLVKFAIGRLLHTADPANFTPLWVNGKVTRQKDSFLLKAAGAGADGGLRFSVSGRHRIADGHGTMQIRVPETAFGKGALQPVHLSPRLADVRDATGRVGATAGLDSHISLDGLLPPSTPAGQEISVRRVDPALPLDDVEIRFQIEPARSPRLRLHEATARFAGGRISVAEAVIDISRPHNFVDVGVDNLDLELLLNLLQVEDVSATGRMSGTIPVDIADAGVAINNGQLAAQGPGVLRVRSEAAASALGGAGEQVALMLSALEDFRYDALSATLDVAGDGDAAVMIHMQGHNPAVLDGYPFAINTGLSGNLTKLLGALRQGAQLSTDLVNPRIR
jgi:hypothetical protein